MDLFDRITGDRNSFNMEHRLYNFFMFGCIVGITLDLIISLQAGLNFSNLLLNWIYTAGVYTWYYISRIKKIYSPVLILISLTINMVNVMLEYFTTNGMEGPIILMLFMGGIVCFLISPKPINHILTLMCFSGIFLLLGLEWLHPEWVHTYDSREQKIFDLGMNLLTTFIMMYIMLNVYKNTYEKEQKVLIQQRLELKRLNENFSQQNFNLEISNQELNKRNKFVQTLLRELNHRVKNNLQVVSALLNMQAGRSDNPQAKAALQDGKNRLISMALLHKKLYGEELFHQISLPEYLDDLLEHILEDMFGEIEIKISKNVEAIILNTAQAVPFGLITNELLTNIQKHAFDPVPKQPMIDIICYKKNNKVHLQIKDNGKGMNSSILKNAKGNFGSELISLLVEQLDGGWQIDANQSGGTSVSIWFPII